MSNKMIDEHDEDIRDSYEIKPTQTSDISETVPNTPSTLDKPILTEPTVKQIKEYQKRRYRKYKKYADTIISSNIDITKLLMRDATLTIDHVSRIASQLGEFISLSYCIAN
jgi:antitoxin component HigA of HigAB toxin-antitoxin module